MKNLTINECCKIARCGRVTLYSKINSGELKAVKLGRKTLIREEALQEWLNNLPSYTKKEKI